MEQPWGEYLRHAVLNLLVFPDCLQALSQPERHRAVKLVLNGAVPWFIIARFWNPGNDCYAHASTVMLRLDSFASTAV